MTMEPQFSGSPAIGWALDYFASVSPLSPSAREALSQHMFLESYPKKFTLQQARRPAQHLFLVAHGLVRSFYPEDNREVTLLLGMEGCVVCALDSLLSGKPAYYQIETLEDSEIIAIAYHDLERLYQEHHEIERLGRMMISMYYLQQDEELRSLRFRSARERYLDLMEKQPEILQRVPLQYVASYLGMTAETLSRIRG